MHPYTFPDGLLNSKIIYASYRLELAKIIPGLRPWEVLSVEQAMDQITYGGDWYREPLGSYTTGPPYIQEWNKDVKVHVFEFLTLFSLLFCIDDDQ